MFRKVRYDPSVGNEFMMETEHCKAHSIYGTVKFDSFRILYNCIPTNGTTS